MKIPINATPTTTNNKDHPSVWSGFYKKALIERQQQLRLTFPNLFSEPEEQQDSTTNCNTSIPLHSPVSTNVLDQPLPVPLSAKQSLPKNVTTSNKTLTSEPITIEPIVLKPVPDAREYADSKFPINGLDETVADHMVENCIGTIGLPVGLALNFVIDGVQMVVPMAVEEPSVIAAVSGSAKTLCSGSSVGFVTKCAARNIITAQVLLLDIHDDRIEQVIDLISSKKNEIISAANLYCENMFQRGGGAVELTVRKIKQSKTVSDSTTSQFLSQYLSSTNNKSESKSQHITSTHWLVVHIDIDVCDAMGANCASTVAEGISPVLVELAGPGTRPSIRIVTNLNPSRVSRAYFKVPVNSLTYKGIPGTQVAARIIEAYHWACDDVFRATTHNKGIMNGIDAVSIATGQDWRAIEAACHSWAAGNGHSNTIGYRSMTKYWIEQDQNIFQLCGELALPITVGTKGGVLATSSIYYYTLGLLGFPNSKQLASIMCCVGLAQNFGALRALCTVGIQCSHMHLHARNIALSAGAPPHAIPEITTWMIAQNLITVNAAKEYLTAHHLFTSLQRRLSLSDDSGYGYTGRMKPPSMFYFREAHDKPLTLNIAFETLGEQPVFLDFTYQSQESPMHAILLGGKTYEWLMQVFPLVDLITMPLTIDHSRSTNLVGRRLKTISLILNVLVRRMMLFLPEETRNFVERIFSRTQEANPLRHTSLINTPNSVQECPNNTRPSIAGYVQSILSQALYYEQPKQTHKVSTLSDLNICYQSNETKVQTHPNTPRSFVKMDWKLPKSGIFCSDIYDNNIYFSDSVESQAEGFSDSTKKTTGNSTDASSTKSFANKSTRSEPSARDILRVGLPLILSVWQVFEIWVTQHIGQALPVLASAIMEECRVIVSALVSMPSDLITRETSHLERYLYTPPDTIIPKTLTEQDVSTLFPRSFKVQAKRSQCTLFLLIDLMVADPQQVLASTIEIVKWVGWTLEQEASIVHDIARLNRDFRAVFHPNYCFSAIQPSTTSFNIQMHAPTDADIDDVSVTLHTNCIRNSMLTFAVLEYHTCPNRNTLTLETVVGSIPKYLAAINLSRLICNTKLHIADYYKDIDMEKDPITLKICKSVAFGYFETTSNALREKLGVLETLACANDDNI